MLQATLPVRALVDPPAPQEGDGRLATLLAGVAGGLWAAGLGLLGVTVLVLTGWATDPRSGASVGDALRSAGQVWVAAHGGTLDVPGGTWGLAPLGLTALAGVLLARAGRGMAEGAGLARWRDHAAATASLALPYGVVTCLVAGFSATGAVGPDPWTALAGGLVVAGVAAGLGAARGAPGLDRRSVPVWVRVQGRAALGALAVLVAASAALTAVSLGVGASRAAPLWDALAPGPAGAVLLLLVCLALLPNVVLWVLGFVTGPGFALGTGATVSPFTVGPAALPALPLLAGAPGPGVPPVWAAGVLLVPVAAGVVAGLLGERAAPSPHVRAALLRACAVAGWTGLAVAALAYASGGPVVGGRLAEVGAAPLVVGLAAAGEVLAGAAAVVVWHVRRHGWG